MSNSTLEQDTLLFWQISLCWHRQIGPSVTISQAINSLKEIDSETMESKKLGSQCRKLKDAIVLHGSKPNKIIKAGAQ